jgi:hypothetical protein
MGNFGKKPVRRRVGSNPLWLRHFTLSFGFSRPSQAPATTGRIGIVQVWILKWVAKHGLARLRPIHRSKSSVESDSGSWRVIIASELKVVKHWNPWDCVARTKKVATMEARPRRSYLGSRIIWQDAAPCSSDQTSWPLPLLAVRRPGHCLASRCLARRLRVKVRWIQTRFGKGRLKQCLR